MDSSPRPSRTEQAASAIEDPALGRRFCQLISTLHGVHPHVRSETTGAEVRLYLDDTVFCRVVAYRELFHVQVGVEPVWETRVRSDAGYLDVLDKALRTLLAALAEGTAGPSHEITCQPG